MALSLRLLISGVSALSVLLVAALTLSLTLTASHAALESLGLSHVGVLQTDASRQTEAFFKKVTRIGDSFSNFTRSRDWAPMNTLDSSAVEPFSAMMQTAFTAHRPPVTGAAAAFNENGVMSWTTTPSKIFDDFIMTLPTPLSEFPNQTYTETRRYFWAANNSPATREDLTAMDIEYERPPAPPARDVGTWAQYMQLTGEGKYPVILPPLAVYDTTNPAMTYVVISPALTASAPLVPRNESDVYAVVFAVFEFQDISKFLIESVKVTPGTAAFVYEQDGFLIGTSEPGTLVERVEVRRAAGCSATDDAGISYYGLPPATLCLQSVSDFDHAGLASLVAAPDADALLFPDKDAGRIERVDKLFVATSQVDLGAYRGLRVYTALLMPEEDVLGDVVRSRNVSIGLTAVLVVVLAGINFAVVMVTLSPLRRVAERMVKAANLEDDGTREPLSGMAEVRTLQEAYFEMVEELNRIRSYVPQAVLYGRRSPGEDGCDDLSSIVVSESSHVSKHRGSGLGSTHNGSGRNGTEKSTPRAATRRNSQSSSSAATLSKSHGAVIGVVGGTTTHHPLVTRVVTVAAWNVEGFLRTTHGGKAFVGPVAGLSQLVSIAEEEVVQRRGVLSFHGDRLTATFNGSRACAGHANAGVASAVAVVSRGQELCPGIGSAIRCGVATGPCAVGSVGSSTAKAVSVLGACFSHAVELERLTRRYDTVEGGIPACRVLVAQRTAAEVQSQMQITMVDLVRMRDKNTGAERALLVASANTDAKVVNGAAGGEQEEEWLYLVRAADSSRDKLFRQLLAGEVPDAVLAGGSQVQLDSDPPLRRLLAKAAELVQQGEATHDTEAGVYRLAGGGLALAQQHCTCGAHPI